MVTRQRDDKDFGDKLRRFYSEEIQRALNHMAVLLEGYQEVTDFGSYHYAVGTYESLRQQARTLSHRRLDVYGMKVLLERILLQLRALAIELEGLADGEEFDVAEWDTGLLCTCAVQHVS